ncbi:uncharacterized protein [Diabrotica undecimpunctata]|uniref:uncharacterized protein n=1 Tax=Diabrotica undecimpunctata TaxID=50387 RepID=UPI003B63873F
MIIVYILGSFLLTISYTACYVINSDRYGLGYINSNEDAETSPYSFYVENNTPSPYLLVNYMVPYAPVNYVVPSYFHNYMFTSDLSVNRNEPKTSAVVDDNSHILDVARINYDKNPENHKKLYTAKDDNADSLNGKEKRFFIRHNRGPLLINADISFVPSENTNHENYQKNLSNEEDTANGINNTTNEGILKNTPKILDNQANANEDLAKDSENYIDKVQSGLQSTQDAKLPQTIEPLGHTLSTNGKASTELDNKNESQEKNFKKKSAANKRGTGNILLGALSSVAKSVLGEDTYDDIETLFKKRSIRNLVGVLEDIEQESTINTTPAGTQLDNPDKSKESILKEKVVTNPRSMGTLSNPIKKLWKKIFKKRSFIDLMRQLKDFEEKSTIDTFLPDSELDNQDESRVNNLEEKVMINTRGIGSFFMGIFQTIVDAIVGEGVQTIFNDRSLTYLLRLLKDFEEESIIDTIVSDADLNKHDKSHVNNLEKNVMINTRGIGSFFMGIWKSIVDAIVGEGVQMMKDRSLTDLLRLLKDFEEESIIDTIVSDADLNKHDKSHVNNLEENVMINTRGIGSFFMGIWKSIVDAIVGEGVQMMKDRSLTDLLRLLKDFEEESIIDTIVSDADLNKHDKSHVNNLEKNVMINTRGIGSFFMGIWKSIVDAIVGEGVQMMKDRSLTDLLRLLKDFQEESIIDTIVSDAELDKRDKSQENNLEEKVTVNTRFISLFSILLSFIGSGVSDLINAFKKRSATDLLRLVKDFEEESTIDNILSGTELNNQDESQENNLEEKVTVNTRFISLFSILLSFIGSGVSDLINAFKKRSAIDLLRLVKDFEEESTIDNILSGTELNNQDESQENNFKKKSTELGTKLYNQESTMEEISTTDTRSILGLIGFTVAKFLVATFISAAESYTGKMTYEGIKELITKSTQRSTINTTNLRSILGIIGGAFKEVLKNTAESAIGQTIWEGIKKIFKKRTLRTLVRILDDSEVKPTINTRINNVLPIGWILPPSSFLTGRPVKFIKDTSVYETSNTDDNKNWEEFVLNKHFIDEKGLFNVEVNSNSNEREHMLKIKVIHKSPEKIFLVDLDKYIYDLFKTFKDIYKHSKKEKKTVRTRRNLQNRDSVGLRDNLEQLNDPNDIDDDLQASLQNNCYYGNEDNILGEPCLYEPFKIDNNVLQQIFFNILYLNKHMEELNWFERREIKPLFLKYIQSLANTYLSPDMKIDLQNLRNYITVGYLNHFYFGIEEPTVLEVIHELMNTVNNIIFKHQNDREMLKLINEQNEQNDRHGNINFVIVKRFKFGNSSLILKIISSSKEQHTVDIELIHTSAEPLSTREVINKYLRRTFKIFKHPKEPLQKIKQLMKNLLDSKKLDQLTNFIKKDPGNSKAKSSNKNKDNEFKESSNNENEVKPFEDFIDDKWLDLEREEHNFFGENSIENESFFTTEDMSYRETNVKQILSKILPTNTILKDINVFKQKYFESPLNDKKRKNSVDLLEKMKKALKKLQFYLVFAKQNLVGKGQHLLFEQIDQLLRLQESYADSLEDSIEPDDHEENLYKYLQRFRKPLQDSIQNDAEQIPDNLEDQEQVALSVDTLDQLLQLQGNYLNSLDDRFQAVALFNDNSLKQPFQEEVKGPQHNMLKNVLSKLQQINMLMKILNVIKQKRFQSHLKDDVRHHIIDIFGNMKRVLSELKTYVGEDNYIPLPNADNIQDNLEGKPEDRKSQQQNRVDVNQIDKLLRLQESYADSLQGIFEAEGIHTENIDNEDLKRSFKNESSIEKPSQNNNNTLQDTEDQKDNPIDVNILDQLIGVQERYVDRLYDMFEAEQLYVEKHTINDLEQQTSGRKGILSTRENILEHIIPKVIFINHQLNDLNELKQKDLVTPINGNNADTITDLLENMKNVLEELKQYMGATKYSFDSLIRDKTLADNNIDNQQTLEDQAQNLLQLDKIDQFIRIQLSYADSLEDLIHVEDRQNDENMDEDLTKRPQGGSFDKNNTKSFENDVKYLPLNLQNKEKHLRDLKAIDQLLKLQHSYLDSLDDMLQDEELDHDKGNVKQFSQNATTYDNKMSLEKDVKQKPRNMGIQQPYVLDVNTIDQYLRLQDNYNRLGDIFAEVELDNEQYHDDLTQPVEDMSSHKKDVKLLLSPKGKILVKDQVLKQILSMLTQINQLLNDPKSFKQKKAKTSQKHTRLRNVFFISEHQKKSTLKHNAEKKTRSSKDKKLKNNKNHKSKLTANSNDNKTLEDDAERKTKSAQDENIEDNRKYNLKLIENPDDNKTLEHDAEKKTQDKKTEDNNKNKLTFAANGDDNKTLEHDVEKRTQSVEDEKIEDNKNDKLELTANKNDNKTLEDEAGRKTPNAQDEKIEDNRKYNLKLIENPDDNKTLEHDAEKKTEDAEDEKIEDSKKDQLKFSATSNDTTLEDDAERRTQNVEDEKLKNNKQDEKIEVNTKHNLKLATNSNDNKTFEDEAENKTQSLDDKIIEDNEKHKLRLIENTNDSNTLENIDGGKLENLKSKELEQNKKEEFMANTNKTNTSTNGDDEKQENLEDEEIHPGEKENNVGNAKPENLENEELEPNEKDEVIPATSTNDTNTANNDENGTQESLDKEEPEHNEKEEFIKDTDKTNTFKNADDEKQENLEDEKIEPEEQKDNDDEGTPENLENKELEHNGNVTTTNNTNPVQNNDNGELGKYALKDIYENHVEQQKEDQVLPKTNNNKTNTVENDTEKEAQNVEDQELGDNEKYKVVPEVNNKDDIEKKPPNVEDKELEDNKSDNSVSTGNINGTDTLKYDMANKLLNDKVVEKNINVTDILGNDAEKNLYNLGDKELKDDNQDELLQWKSAIAEEITPSSRTALKPKSKIRNMHDKKKTKNRNGKLNKNKSKDEDKAKKGNVRKEKQTYKENGRKLKNKNNTSVRSNIAKTNRFIIPVKYNADIGLPPQVEIEHDNPSSELTNLEDSVNVQSSDENKLSETTVLKPEIPVTHTEPPPPIEKISQSTVAQESQTTETQKPPDTVDFKIFRETQNGNESTSDHK